MIVIDSKRILVGVISYLPNDLDRRQKRLTAHKQQLDWIKNVFTVNGPIDLKCIYQCYKPEEVPDILQDNEYDLYDHGLHIAPARNKVLDYFYNNDVYDVCVILDDDRLLYDYYGIEYFLQDLLNSNNPYINIITTLAPRNMPFKQYNTEFKDIIENNWTLHECPPQVNGFYILYKNIKKYKIYFEDLDIHKYEGFEDIDFMLNMFRHHIRPYMCRQLITKTLLEEDSTWVADHNQRMDIRALNLQALCDKYLDLGIQRKYRKNGRFAGFTHPICISDTPKQLTIKRGVPYVLESNLIYNKRNKPDVTNFLF